MPALPQIHQENYDIVGSYNNQRNTAISAERSVNIFEYIDPGAKRPHVNLPTSGLVDQELTFVDSGATDPGRMQFVFNSAMYLLVGARLFRVTQSSGELAISSAGTITSSSGFVGVDANTFQVFFVDGTKGYIYDTTNGLREITDPGFPNAPVDCTYLDGFFIVADGDSNQFYLSSLEQGLVWSEQSGTCNFTNLSDTIALVSPLTTASYQIGTPVVFDTTVGATFVAGTTYYVVAHPSSTSIKVSKTQGGAAITSDATSVGVGITNSGASQIGSITTHPGKIVACRTLHRRLFLFSENYTEVWENQGVGTNLPLRRNNSLLIEYGTPSADSVATGFDMMIFLSQDAGGLGAVMQITGISALPISTSALDYQLSQYAQNNQVSDANGMLIKENGLIFYRLNFTAANKTFVYNATQSNEQKRMWHEEEDLPGNRHWAQTHGYFVGNNYVLDYARPVLYKLDPNWYLNGTEKIRRMRIAKSLMPNSQKRIRVDRFELDLLQGSNLSVISTSLEFDLQTESELGLLTESGDNLILEQEGVVDSEEYLFTFLSLSKDSGQSFGNNLPGPLFPAKGGGYDAAIKANMGLVGDRTYRTVWRKLGTVPRDQAFVPKIEFFNDAAFVMIGASWTYEILPE